MLILILFCTLLIFWAGNSALPKNKFIITHARSKHSGGFVQSADGQDGRQNVQRNIIAALVVLLLRVYSLATVLSAFSLYIL